MKKLQKTYFKIEKMIKTTQYSGRSDSDWDKINKTYTKLIKAQLIFIEYSLIKHKLSFIGILLLNSERSPEK